MSSTDTFVANAERYAANFDKGDLPMPPASHTLVLACMDARLSPYGVLGLSEGDAHVVRNAGGVVTDDVIRSITISQRLPRSRPTPACGRRSPWRPSATSTATSGSPSPGSRPAPTCRTRTRCGASSTRSRPAACERSRTDWPLRTMLSWRSSR
ncbi:MAG: carbonic anhydrase [Streptosporangiaceae bacterium]